MNDTLDVLVVEDEPAIRRLLVVSVQRLGLTAAEAVNGNAALEMLRQRRFKVVLLDLMMPVLDGMGVLAGIDCELDVERKPAVIVISAGARSTRFSHPCVKAVLHKPFDLNELGRVIAGAIAGPARAC